MNNEKNNDFILGSSSPSRLELLKQINYFPKKIIKSEIDETPLKKEKVKDYVKRIAKTKVLKLFEDNKNENILCADTIAVVNNKIIQKPHIDEKMKEFLKMFSNKNVKILTAVYFVNKKGIFTEKIIETKIKFKQFNQKDIDDLIKYSFSLNCAGGIRIEGFTSGVVKSINGEYSNIMGLPLYEVRNIFISNNI